MRKRRELIPAGEVSTPNKLNADVKAMILAALAAKGGQKYLEKQADENLPLFSRCSPRSSRCR